MKYQKDKEVRAAFKLEKNKAYKFNRASIGMILLIFHRHLRIFHFLTWKISLVLYIRPEKVCRHHSWVHSRNHERLLSKDYQIAEVGLLAPYNRLSFQCFVLFISQIYIFFFVFLFKDSWICDPVYLKVNLTSAQQREV